jgi:hypothetical protein
MLTILHGENIVASRNFLNSLIKQAQRKGIAIAKLANENFQINNLVSALEPDLFGQIKLVILDEFQKFSPQNQKDITKVARKLAPENHLIIWSNKKLLAKTLKLFPQSKSQLFKPSSRIFKFLDFLAPKNKINNLRLLNQTLAQDGVNLVFYLLIGRIEELILVKTGHQSELKKAPWQTKRLIFQAEKFPLPTLEKLLKQLILLDYRQKTGRLAYTPDFGLELLIAKL